MVIYAILVGVCMKVHARPGMGEFQEYKSLGITSKARAPQRPNKASAGWGDPEVENLSYQDTNLGNKSNYMASTHRCLHKQFQM